MVFFRYIFVNILYESVNNDYHHVPMEHLDKIQSTSNQSKQVTKTMLH